MIERYLNPEINSLWDDQNKFDTWKLVQEKYVETLEELNVAEKGIAKKINKSELSLPLDVHTGRIARDLRLLSRNQNDSKSVQEIDLKLREMDPIDPVKYDYALFGLGVYEKF